MATAAAQQRHAKGQATKAERRPRRARGEKFPDPTSRPVRLEQQALRRAEKSLCKEVPSETAAQISLRKCQANTRTGHVRAADAGSYNPVVSVSALIPPALEGTNSAPPADQAPAEPPAEPPADPPPKAKKARTLPQQACVDRKRRVRHGRVSVICNPSPSPPFPFLPFSSLPSFPTSPSHSLPCCAVEEWCSPRGWCADGGRHRRRAQRSSNKGVYLCLYLHLCILCVCVCDCCACTDTLQSLLIIMMSSKYY